MPTGLCRNLRFGTELEVLQTFGTLPHHHCSCSALHLVGCVLNNKTEMTHALSVQTVCCDSSLVQLFRNEDPFLNNMRVRDFLKEHGAVD